MRVYVFIIDALTNHLPTTFIALLQ